MTRRPKKAARKSVRKPGRTVVRKPARKTSARPAKRTSKRTARLVVAAQDDSLDAFIAAGAGSLGLTIDPVWMPAVRSYLEATLRHGASVTAFALPDESEPAPVFRA